jgi:hypothetical protein
MVKIKDKYVYVKIIEYLMLSYEKRSKGVYHDVEIARDKLVRPGN